MSQTPIEAEAVTIAGAKAHWLDETTVVIKDAGSLARVELRHGQNAQITVTENETLDGGQPLALSATSLAPALAEKFPHLSDWPAFEVQAGNSDIKAALKGQLVAAGFNSSDDLVMATGVQIPGVLDDLFAYNGELGAVINLSLIHI